MNISKRAVALIFCFFASLQLVGCSLPGKGVTAEQALKFTTDYQAVFLDNGQVFFGKIEQPGSDYLLLKEVYLVHNQVNPETKEVKNVLVKRSQEGHAPDSMYINSRHIVVIEPVGPNSKVAQVIKEMASQQGLSPKS